MAIAVRQTKVILDKEKKKKRNYTSTTVVQFPLIRDARRPRGGTSRHVGVDPRLSFAHASSQCTISPPSASHRLNIIHIQSRCFTHTYARYKQCITMRGTYQM